ncbi:MAG: nucleotidyltransferase family protein, partial [Eubacteriaceae bacterium]|nr:nucleotidyltransferase family protein [Eubacteriaceae bacterium]
MHRCCHFLCTLIYHFLCICNFYLQLSSHLENIYELNKKRNLEIIQQVDQINTILKHENISPVYLKGTGNLLDQLYSDPGERMIGDIDLLVKEFDYLKTIDTIISLGYNYEKRELASNVLPKHFNRLYRQDVPADVEIHRVPVNILFSGKFNTEMIFANRIPAQGKEDCYVPSTEHRII